MGCGFWLYQIGLVLCSSILFRGFNLGALGPWNFMRKMMEKGEIGKKGDGFIDRSKVRILLCENDSKSSEEVFTLLCKCSYQVTCVRSPRQVVDALNAEGADIDIILSEIDLPMSKGLKMLKYLMRDKELRRIPVIMMSAQDEVSIVVKCLKLGAADYLVKPLRTNELLNLWTHMWRRRQMLGLAEKNILSYDFDLIGSDPSDANTNSTTLFSDDTDEKSRKACSPTMKEDEVNATSSAPINCTAVVKLFSQGCEPDVPGISDLYAGQMLPFPKKSELKIGESSAFCTYVKSTLPIHNSCLLSDQVTEHLSNDDFANTDNLPDSLSSPEKTCTPPPSSLGLSQEKSSSALPRRNESHNDVPSFPTNAPPYPYYIHQMMMPPPSAMYQNNLPMLPQYSQMPHCYTNPPGIPSFPFYPYGVCLQPGQIPSPHPWPPPPPPYNGNASSSAAEKIEKPIKMDRREAALIKFRQKRKERCFNKKIRYVNRKKQAEQRPRVKGQFIGKINGVTVDPNGIPIPVPVYDDGDDVDDDDDDGDEDK